MGSLAASRGSLKGAANNSSLGTAGYLPTFTPLRTVLDNPIRQSSFKSDVAPGFFRFDPFVLQDLFAFSLKFSVERRILEQIVRGTRVYGFVRHVVAS